MPRLEIRLLGPLEVRVDGEMVGRFRTEKSAALLAYLATELGHPCSRGLLATLFWPEYSDRAARVNLRGILSNLRRGLRDAEAKVPAILAGRDTIQLDPFSGYWLDLAAFRQLAAEGEIEALEQAMALWRGDFMKGFCLPDCPEYEDWQGLWRDRLRREALAALKDLALAYEGRGALDRASECARQMVEMEPWDEEAHRELMRLLALNGQRVEALAQYEACRRTLREDLDVEPSALTMALYERIRDQVIGPSPGGQAADLPVSLVPLVGRQRELERIVVRLRDPACRLLTLVGPGGVGKTRLAVEACRQAALQFEHGLCFVFLSSIESVDDVTPAIAQGLEFDFYPDTNLSPKGQLLAYLREKQLLLVLDSCEHLLEGAALVADILGTAPGVKVLATSRARLNLPGEELFPVSGLEYRMLSKGLPSAMELFAEIARRARPEYAVSEADASAVASICQRVEGMPLAVMLAASWMQMLSPGEIAAELAQDSGHGIEFLEADWHGVPERERSMRATLDRSWRLLTVQEQGILAGLSIFRDGFTAEGAKAVIGASLRDLARLVDRSLVYRRESGRYDLHDLLREYAAIKLAGSADGGEGAADRHMMHYMCRLARWKDLNADADVASTEIDTEWENIRAAWARGVGQSQWHLLGNATRALMRHSTAYSGYTDVAALLRLAEERWRAESGEPSARTGPALHAMGTILGSRGLADYQLGRVAEAVAPLQESLALLEEAAKLGADTRREMAESTRRLGDVLHISKPDQGMPYFVRAIELSRQVQSREELGRALYMGGRVALQLGDVMLARQWLDESLGIWRSRGDVSDQVQCLFALLLCELEEGPFEQATRWLDEAHAIAQRVGHAQLPPKAREFLAAMFYVAGRFEETQPLDEDREAELRKRGLLYPVGDIPMSQVQKKDSGRYTKACSHVVEALGRCQERGDALGVCGCNLYLGRIALGEGDLAEAERWLARMVEGEAQGFYNLTCLLGAPVAILAGRWQEAHRFLCEALRYRISAESLPIAALYYALRGDAERAVELYSLARIYPWLGRSRFCADAYGRHIEAAAATLPPEAVQAAEERGRALNPKATVLQLLAELENDPVGGE